MIRSLLSNEEAVLLQGYSHSPIKLIRLKAMAVLSRDRYVPVDTLAVMINRKRTPITRWISAHSLSRMASIFSGMTDNQHTAKLTRAQKLDIKATL